jgi:hypothetical protein
MRQILSLLTQNILQVNLFEIGYVIFHSPSIHSFQFEQEERCKETAGEHIAHMTQRLTHPWIPC